MVIADAHWYAIRDADDRGLALYRRHYSAAIAATKAPSGPRRFRWFVGPGDRLVLLTTDGLALFSWRHQAHRLDGQTGVCCSIFRNEGPLRSSDLILEADDLAWSKWPHERHFTFVDPTRIKSTNPGCCFKKAGWRRCGTSSRGLHILERTPEDTSP